MQSRGRRGNKTDDRAPTGYHRTKRIVKPNFRLKIQGYIHYLQRWDVIFKTKGPERCLLGATKASSRWREVSWVALILLVIPFRTALLVPASDRASQTAQEHADRGLQLAQSGDLKGAEAELHKALALSP